MHTHKVNIFPPSCVRLQSAASASSCGFAGFSGAVPVFVPHVLVPGHLLQLLPRVGTPGTSPACPSFLSNFIKGCLAVSCRNQPASNSNQIEELKEEYPGGGLGKEGSKPSFSSGSAAGSLTAIASMSPQVPAAGF